MYKWYNFKFSTKNSIYAVKFSKGLKRHLLFNVMQVFVIVKLNPKTNIMQTGTSNEFLRFRMQRCHRELKINQPLSSFTCDSWEKACHVYCEFGTKGVLLELRHRGGRCFKGSTLLDTLTFSWNDLLRAPSLNLGREIKQKVRVVASITPPIQASYLLKCVPDRVTDDSGEMISDVILRMNQYRPQEGRWFSRTVLDHAGRECFVVRMRLSFNPLTLMYWTTTVWVNFIFLMALVRPFLNKTLEYKWQSRRRNLEERRGSPFNCEMGGQNYWDTRRFLVLRSWFHW